MNEILYHNLLFLYQYQNKNSVIGVPKDLIEQLLVMLEKDIKDKNWECPGSR